MQLTEETSGATGVYRLNGLSQLVCSSSGLEEERKTNAFLQSSHGTDDLLQNIAKAVKEARESHKPKLRS